MVQVQAAVSRCRLNRTMLFNSTLYLGFLLIVVLLFHQFTGSCRRALLLLASLIFYSVWSIEFSFLLMGSIAVGHWSARFIEGSDDPRLRRYALIASIVYNLGILAVFKYADFLTIEIHQILGVHPWPVLDLILPLGLSFYTFQAMSYTIDVYRGMRAAERWQDVALFISFFPQLVAGPIVRASFLMPQLGCEPTPVDPKLFHRGLMLILWGFVKKVYIGDPMGSVANEIFAAPERYGAFDLVMGVYAFTVQIYCDFSGYSDIAIGSALLLGIHLPKNFDAPYLSRTITEFWRRWHISLSTWLRDYLYIPLGGNRFGTVRTYVNLMITMLLGGLWHGAGWNWLIWGGLQGLFLTAERATGLDKRAVTGPWSVLRWVITLHLVCFSWIFFRSADMPQALLIIARIADVAEGALSVGPRPLFYLVGLVGVELLGVRSRLLDFGALHPLAARRLAYVAFLILALTFSGASNREFIYFQF